MQSLQSVVSGLVFAGLFCLIVVFETAGNTARAEPGNTFSVNPPVMQARNTKYNGDVIFVRGGFGVFSRGLDAMAAQLARRGVKVRVVRNAEVRKTYRQIVNNQKRYGRKPVILVGHSWGADAAIDIARLLQNYKIRVNYLATFAATAPKPIPYNVRKVTNYYFKTNGWGRAVKRGKGMKGQLNNIDLSTKRGFNHFNVEKKPQLQRRVINDILRIVRHGKRA